MTLPYPPPYMDKATLAKHLCVCPNTVEAWALAGILPPGQLKCGKRMWKWVDVQSWMDSNDAETRSIADAVRREREADERKKRH